VISFHYVSTGEFTYEGETETQREEGYFMGDTATVAYEPGEPYDEIIVIGQDAWAPRFLRRVVVLTGSI
jgi:hypothetical protein